MAEQDIAPRDLEAEIPQLVCACDSIVEEGDLETARAACVGDAVYEHEGKSFCVMHYLSQNKIEAFRAALLQKIEDKDFNFCGAFFPEKIDFQDYDETRDFCFCFSAQANFRYATFSATATFDVVTFNENAYFGFATFREEAFFRAATFSAQAFFNSTTFSGLALFTHTQFVGPAYFDNAQFKDYVKFTGHKQAIAETTKLDFDSLRIEKSERLSFHSLQLRPHWFINTDPRKFEFIDVKWSDDLAKERGASTKKEYSNRLLSIAYRQLAMNAEENNRYGEAAQFRYNSMDLRRLEKFNGRAFWTLDFWYWALSGYGERVGRATVALFLILFLPCVPYWFTGFASSKDTTQNKIGAPIQVMLAPEQNKAKQFLATLVYSLETASLQKPEPRPVTTMARLFVGLETILAPLQAALLALAIRRKYMR